MRRQQKDLAFADRHVVDPARFGHLQDYVAAQLVEKLLTGVVVKVDPLVRAAENHHDHTGVFEHHFVADRRSQKMAMRVDPSRKVEWLAEARYRHRVLLFMAPPSRWRDAGNCTRGR